MNESPLIACAYIWHCIY